MPYTRRTWKDEIVQYPSRYQLKDTSTGSVVATYDLQRTTGTVTEPADIINAVKLNNMEAGIKELSDAVFTPTTATTTLNSTAPIVSVTDSVDGMADVEVGGATLNQVVVNGDFANGTTGWSGNLASISVANGVVTSTATGQFGGAQRINIPLQVGKYFIKAKVKSTSNLVRIALDRADSPFNNWVTSNFHDGSSQFRDLYGIGTVSTASNTGVIRIRDNRTSGWDAVEADDFVIIPITGTPYESMTADQINNIVGEYWEGLKSVESADVVSVGRNLLPTNESDWEQGQLVSGSPSASTNHIRTKGFYSIKPNQQLIASSASGFVLSALSHYDKNNNFIETTGASFTSKPNAVKVKAVYRKEPSAIITPADVAQLKPMLNEGSTALTYQVYDGSKLSVRYNDRTKFDGALLQNGRDNEVNISRGYISAVKRVARYVLQASDITLNTGLSNIDLIEINKSSLVGIVNSTNPSSGQMLVSGRWEFKGTTANWNDANNNGAYAYNAGLATNPLLFVTKGTYANTADARTALAGLVIYYELAQPIFIPYEQFATYGIDVDGILSSNNGYTQFYLDNYNILPPTPIVYPANINASVQSLKNGLEVVNAKADDLEAKKANLDEGNFFNGTQVVTGGDIAQRQTTAGTVNKRFFAWTVGTGAYILNAINDAGGVVRNLLEVFHDGGMRVFGRLFANDIVQLANGKALTALNTTGTERNLAVLGGDNNTYLGDANHPTILQGTVTSMPTTLFRNQGGSEGGEIQLQKPASGSSLVGNVIGDIAGNRLRIFDEGSPFKGVYIDIAQAGDNVSNRLSQDRGWKTVTLATGSWTANTFIADYGFYYSITDADFIVGDVVDFEVGFGANSANIPTAENAGMANSIISGSNGGFLFCAKAIPATNLNVKYRINK